MRRTCGFWRPDPITEPGNGKAAVAPLGSSRLNQWRVSETDVDLVRRRPALRRLRIEATPQAVTLDLECTAILVIDMQNDFCHPDGWLGHIGVDVARICGSARLFGTGAHVAQPRAGRRSSLSLRPGPPELRRWFISRLYCGRWATSRVRCLSFTTPRPEFLASRISARKRTGSRTLPCSN